MRTRIGRYTANAASARRFAESRSWAIYVRNPSDENRCRALIATLGGDVTQCILVLTSLRELRHEMVPDLYLDVLVVPSATLGSRMIGVKRLCEKHGVIFLSVDPDRTDWEEAYRDWLK